MDKSVKKSLSEMKQIIPGGACRGGYLEEEKKFGAGNETRTRDPDLGKVVLYQLSYSRLIFVFHAAAWLQPESLRFWWCVSCDTFQILERETRLELATPTLARSCSTN